MLTCNNNNNNNNTHNIPARSWASVASQPAARVQGSLVTLVPTPPVSLPSVTLPPSTSVLTLATALQLTRDRADAPPSALAAARALLKGIGTPLPLCPRTGNPDRPSPSIMSLGFAPTHNAHTAFNTFDAAQNSLRAGASLARTSLPPHVLIPGVGRWTYVYVLASHFPFLTHILAHTRCIFEDLQTSETPLPLATQGLPRSAAAGVARRLSNEEATLVSRSKVTSIPMPTRRAFASALEIHAHSITQSLAATAEKINPSAAVNPNPSLPASHPPPTSININAPPTAPSSSRAAAVDDTFQTPSQTTDSLNKKQASINPGCPSSVPNPSPPAHHTRSRQAPPAPAATTHGEHNASQRSRAVPPDVGQTQPATSRDQSPATIQPCPCPADTNMTSQKRPLSPSAHSQPPQRSRCTRTPPLPKIQTPPDVPGPNVDLNAERRLEAARTS